VKNSLEAGIPSILENIENPAASSNTDYTYVEGHKLPHKNTFYGTDEDVQHRKIWQSEPKEKLVNLNREL